MVADLYPRSWSHLEVARQARADLGALWSELLGDGLAGVKAATGADSWGRILAYVDWPNGCRERLTGLFDRCVGSLWACLDSLVEESVEMFSILKRPRNPTAPRFFPIADSAENFEALLAESCMDGVLRLQFAMVRDCQPFHRRSEDERVERFRSGLRQLLDWTARLEDGALVGAWATPGNPQIHVEAPTKLVRLEVQPPGEVVEERIVARYLLSDYLPGSDVLGEADTYLDLAFPDGFTPQDADDRFDRRLEFVIDVVTRFAVSFAWLAGRVPGARRVLLGVHAEGAETWIEAARSPRGWTDEELEALAASDLGVGVVQQTDQLTLIVSTPEGVFERVIPDASPLRHQASRGIAAERATQDAAATWGLPDFVLPSQQVRKGTGTREIGDGLLVVGDRGAIIQAKTRDVDSQEPAQEAAWIDKQIKKAIGQANGTARYLSTTTNQMVNGRGRLMTIDGGAISWVAVIIIEHPNPPPDYQVPTIESRLPVVVLLRRDWEFLFNQLRSTRAVVDYLHRVGESTERLGTEPHRYYELAAADASAAAEENDSTSQHGRGQQRSVPLLPAAPAGRDDDEAHGMVRLMCEDIAVTPTERPEEDRLRVLAAIDGLPVAYRTDLGRLLLTGLQAVRQTEPETTTWQFRTFRPSASGQPQLGFGVCPRLTDITRTAFRSWFLLRHHERGDTEPLAEATSVGILLTPRHDGYRDWDTTMIAITGDPQLTDDELSQSRELWNTRSDGVPNVGSANDTDESAGRGQLPS